MRDLRDLGTQVYLNNNNNNNHTNNAKNNNNNKHVKPKSLGSDGHSRPNRLGYPNLLE
jgi:hypothetical protein